MCIAMPVWHCAFKDTIRPSLAGRIGRCNDSRTALASTGTSFRYARRWRFNRWASKVSNSAGMTDSSSASTSAPSDKLMIR